MSSPPDSETQSRENTADFRNISTWIESVDESKPLGKLVAHYAKQKWWEGFFTGYFGGIASGVILGGAIATVLRRRL